MAASWMAPDINASSRYFIPCPGRQGAADCGEYREAAGTVAQVNIALTTRSNQKAAGVSPCLNKVRLSSRRTAK
jgi:hypothetical protein